MQAVRIGVGNAELVVAQELLLHRQVAVLCVTVFKVTCHRERERQDRDRDAGCKEVLIGEDRIHEVRIEALLVRQITERSRDPVPAQNSLKDGCRVHGAPGRQRGDRNARGRAAAGNQLRGESAFRGE